MAGLSRLLVALVLILAVPAHAWAAASPWWETDHGAVRLVAATNTAGVADRLAFGLHFRMKPGWKIYWRSPGDAGFPPQPNWAGSTNVAAADIAWPAPKRFSVLGFETLGYEDEVVLPLAVTPFEPGKAVQLRGTINYLTCDDICVPYEAAVALDLPAGPPATAREAGLIETYAARVPSADGAGMQIAAAEVEPRGAGATLRIELRADAPLQRPDVYVEGPAQLSFAAPQVQMRDGGRAALLRVAVGVPRGRAADLAGQSVTLTVVDGDRAVERTVTLAPASTPAATSALPPPAPAATGFVVVLGLALLGGLILNLMPCVLPVLSLKLLSLIDARGRAPSAVRRRFLATAAGILASFVALATIAVALKGAGLAVGWGIQFQQPVFLAAMAFVVVLFAANLWGFFHISLPAVVGDAAAGVAMRGHDSLSGHFLTGALATLLATPCSAPFVGSAVGFALSGGPADIYAVFVALGLGLAAPYLTVAAWPGAARLLPRPGRWMTGLRIALGVALIGTAAWLLSVVAVQSGAAVAASLAALLAVLVAVLWMLHRLRAPGRRAAWTAVAALALAVVALPAAWRELDRQPDIADASDRGPWRPFSADALAAAVAAGKTVVVDVTADWCLTCKVNKTVVLDRGEIRARLGSADVVALQADWTRPDPAIAAYLAGFGRYGIPFNAVYGPNARHGIVLPELLSHDAVSRALDEAAGLRVVGARGGGGVTSPPQYPMSVLPGRRNHTGVDRSGGSDGNQDW